MTTAILKNNIKAMLDMHFEDTGVAFRDKSDAQLARSFWLFQLLGRPRLVSLGSWMLRIALRVRFPVSWAIKPTIFAHFCGGEHIEACEPTIQKLYSSGILTILDYSAEGKQTEADFNSTMSQIILTIDKAAGQPAIPYAVFKPSGLVQVDLLEKLQSGKTLDPTENRALSAFHDRVMHICDYAFRKNIPVMIDAEESWIQDEIDGLTEKLMEKFNRDKPMVFNTLQMYRNDRLEYLDRIYRRSQDRGYYPAFKLVRGAYMEKERDRALAQGYPSPIHPDKPATDAAFDQAVMYCLDRIERMAVCIGTHNESSCALAVAHMHNNNIARKHPNISFAQLLGMSDHISYKLGAEGYNVCKYVPYGPVHTVIPYLIRRAEENTSVAGQTSRELFLIRKERARRKARLAT